MVRAVLARSLADECSRYSCTPTMQKRRHPFSQIAPKTILWRFQRCRPIALLQAGGKGRSPCPCGRFSATLRSVRKGNQTKQRKNKKPSRYGVLIMRQRIRPTRHLSVCHIYEATGRHFSSAFSVPLVRILARRPPRNFAFKNPSAPGATTWSIQ